MSRITIILAALVVLAAPAWATQYAVPDNGNVANDCVSGYICLDDGTAQTFSIGSLSFPPPFLKAAKPADLAAHGILAVTQTPQPSGNFASITSSIQMVSGVPTVVWATTALPAPTDAQVAQAAFNAALAAGLTVSCASGATVCTSAITGTYSTTATAQAALSAIMAGVGAGQGLPGGGSTFYYLDAANAPHPFNAAQITELYNAGRDYIYALDLFAAGAGKQPAAITSLP